MALSDGLIAYYKLDDGADSVGTATLTATGGPTFSAAKIGNGLNNPGGGARLISSSAAIFDLTGPVTRTFALWMKFDTLTTSPGILSNFANVGGSAVQYLLWYDSAKLRFRVRDGAAADHEAVSAGALSTGVWYHVVCSYNASNGQVSLTLDGVTTTNTSATVAGGTCEFALGNRNAGGDGFDGLIDELGVWNRILTAGEITSLNNGGAGLQYPFGEAPPVSAFTGNPLSGSYPTSVVFTDGSSNTPTGWSWSFGDGGTSGSQSPTHIYQVAGGFDVRLITSNSNGTDTLTRLAYINISTPADGYTSPANPTVRAPYNNSERPYYRDGGSPSHILDWIGGM